MRFPTRGSFTITVLVLTIACNSGGGGPAVTAPTITTQPTSKNVLTGQTASFTVVATGSAPLSYNWRRGGFGISGGNSATYSTAATTSADDGAQFDVVVSNSAGSVTSSAVTLSVAAAGSPVIGSFTANPTTLPFGGGAVTLSWTVSGADTIAVDQGVGDVTGQTSKSVNVGTTTSFTLSATNGTGTTTASVSVMVASANDKFVDPVSGNDSNDGSEAAPYKRITKAVTTVQSGSTIFLADGTYDLTNEGCPTGCITVAAVVPDGVTVRAKNPRKAVLDRISLTANNASVTVVDLVLTGVYGGIVGGSTVAGKTIAISGTQFTNRASIQIVGMMSATISAGSTLTEPIALARVGPFAAVSNSARLTVQGGVLDGSDAGVPSFGGGFMTAAGNAQIVLDGVTLKNWKAGGIFAGSNATTNAPSVTLQGGTVLDTVGAPGNCAATAAVIVSGTSTLILDHAQILNSPSAGICVRSGSDLAVTLTSSKLEGNFQGLATEPGSANAALTFTTSQVVSNTHQGVLWTGGGTIATVSSDFDGNETGIELRGGGSSLGVTFTRSTFRNNASYGFWLNDPSN
jgi:hypothetical protein